MTEKQTTPEAQLAAAMRAAGLGGFRVAAVLGSGLGGFADRLEDPLVVPYEDLEGMPRSTVPGHSGRFVQGHLGGETVLLQQGRVHLYEGHSAARVTLAVRAMAELGARALLLTNAAGGIEASWPVPSLMRITDHLNLQGRAPLRRAEAGFGCPYDPEAGAIFEQAARETEVPLHAGVYAGLLGPTYETAAEIRMLAQMGAQAVGMSTVAEASVAHAVGMRVVGISLISNPAAGIATGPLNHEEVTEAGIQYAEHFSRLLQAGLPRVAQAVA